MSVNDHFKVAIASSSIFIRKATAALSIVLAHENTLERGVIKMPTRRVKVLSSALSNGLQSPTLSSGSSPPTRLILGFVSNEAYNGNFTKNPLSFTITI
ncbi:uncharacterized protein F54H12.2 [Trichonephila clavipes]|nr:uncharacterized protein F54H12.2 [Trichonephila clavipes]